MGLEGEVRISHLSDILSFKSRVLKFEDLKKYNVAHIKEK